MEEEEGEKEEFKDIRKTCSLRTNCAWKGKGRKRKGLRAVGGVQEKECRAIATSREILWAWDGGGKGKKKRGGSRISRVDWRREERRG